MSGEEALIQMMDADDDDVGGGNLPGNGPRMENVTINYRSLEDGDANLETSAAVDSADGNTRHSALNETCDDSEEDQGSYVVNPGGDSTDSDAPSEGESWTTYEDNEDDFNQDLNFGNTDEALSLRLRKRQANPELPKTVTVLETGIGGKVYLVGTAHFSEESQEDVAKTIKAVQPDKVLVELDTSRANILTLNEQVLLEEAKNINYQKIRDSIKQSGVLSGLMQVLLLSMSANLTKQLGLAPGGEFRRAYQEAQNIPGCMVVLGDRPVLITLRRAMAQLTLWQKFKVAWHLITENDTVTKEDVEKCKEKDWMEEMLREMAGEFPALNEVFVKERDTFLAYSLRGAASVNNDREFGPSVVVGVVGMGHVPGIKENWNKHSDISSLMRVPPQPLRSRIFFWSAKIGFWGIMAWGCYKLIRVSSHGISRLLVS